MNQDNPFAKGVSINQDILTDDIYNPAARVTLIIYDKGSTDIYNSDLYANHPTLNRELLALGREEE